MNCYENSTWIAFLTTISEYSEQNTHKEKYSLSIKVWKLNEYKFPVKEYRADSIITYSPEILYDNVIYQVRQTFPMFSPKIMKIH